MRGVGGPLLTIGDLLSDLAVDGGDDSLAAGGDASVPSSPSAVQQVGEANPSDLSPLFEVRSPFRFSLLVSICFLSIDSSILCCLCTTRFVELLITICI